MLRYIEESRDQLATIHIHRKKTVVHHEKVSTWTSSKTQDSDYYHHQHSATSKNGTNKVTLINAYESPPIEPTLNVSATRTNGNRSKNFRVRVFRNGDESIFAYCASCSIAIILSEATRKLQMIRRAQRLFEYNGHEIFRSEDIQRDMDYYVSEGEDFISPLVAIKSKIQYRLHSKWTLIGIRSSYKIKPPRRVRRRRIGDIDNDEPIDYEEEPLIQHDNKHTQTTITCENKDVQTNEKPSTQNRTIQTATTKYDSKGVQANGMISFQNKDTQTMTKYDNKDVQTDRKTSIDNKDTQTIIQLEHKDIQTDHKILLETKDTQTTMRCDDVETQTETLTFPSPSDELEPKLPPPSEELGPKPPPSGEPKPPPSGEPGPKPSPSGEPEPKPPPSGEPEPKPPPSGQLGPKPPPSGEPGPKLPPPSEPGPKPPPPPIEPGPKPPPPSEPGPKPPPRDEPGPKPPPRDEPGPKPPPRDEPGPKPPPRGEPGPKPPPSGEPGPKLPPSGEPGPKPPPPSEPGPKPPPRGKPGPKPPPPGEPGPKPPPHGEPGTKPPPHGEPGTKPPPRGEPGPKPPPFGGTGPNPNIHPIYNRPNTPTNFRVRVYRNGERSRYAYCKSCSMDIILSASTQKLQMPMPARRLFDENGIEIFYSRDIQRDSKYYVSSGENFKKPSK